ncbi:hypothetical protein Gotri_005714 [Gossypium trilobum]|uniref:SAWADEE domain-containing protein n=1 Tax=Gossypium trilobum TaxID=34281 RepID=A0A7J9EXF7_9ROSI|nr:hypothetical protein [Gossypium trilobum]
MGEKIPDLSGLEFEARSSKDGAWYDVDTFLTQRHPGSGEPEVLVRFVGFGADEDEWVNVKKAVRLRSIPFQHSECNKVMVGDLVLCLQEKRDQLIYYDVHVNEVERKTHDIRGCRCIFLIRYDHDGSEASVVSHCILLLINNSIAGESSIEKTILYSRPRNLIVFMILLNLCSSPNHIFALSSV